MRDFPVKDILESLEENKAILIGMRTPEQISYLKENTKFSLIALDADKKIRYERAIKRNKIYENINSIKEFNEKELAENNGDHPQRLFEIMKLADYKIENNGSFEDLFKKIDEILSKSSFSSDRELV